jgi:hypothetical protein
MLDKHEYYKDTLERFLQLSDSEIIYAFNREVGNQGWGSIRAAYLAAIHKEFSRRNFDFSEIGDQQSLSFKRKVNLFGNKLVPVSE